MKNINLEDYTLVNNEKEFLEMWPDPEKGKYIPYVSEKPEQYPCLVKEITIVDYTHASCNDEAILSILYFEG